VASGVCGPGIRWSRAGVNRLIPVRGAIMGDRLDTRFTTRPRTEMYLRGIRGYDLTLHCSIHSANSSASTNVLPSQKAAKELNTNSPIPITTLISKGIQTRGRPPIAQPITRTKEGNSINSKAGKPWIRSDLQSIRRCRESLGGGAAVSLDFGPSHKSTR
jgi:hypothetical protein